MAPLLTALSLSRTRKQPDEVTLSGKVTQYIEAVAEPARLQAVLQGAFVSAPMYIMIMSIMTRETFIKVLREEPFVLLSALISYFSAITAAVNYVHYKHEAPQKYIKEQMGVWIALYLAADLGFRAMGIAVFAYALGPHLATMLFGAGFSVAVAATIMYFFRHKNAAVARFASDTRFDSEEAKAAAAARAAWLETVVKVFGVYLTLFLPIFIRKAVVDRDTRSMDAKHNEYKGLAYKEAIRSSSLCAVLALGGLWSGFPHPHQDEVFRCATVTLTIAAVVTKFLVLPFILIDKEEGRNVWTKCIEDTIDGSHQWLYEPVRDSEHYDPDRTSMHHAPNRRRSQPYTRLDNEES
jgi:hypothetical protein